MFLPSMFLPFLPASSDCFQQASHDRNIADRKMLVHDLPIFLQRRSRQGKGMNSRGMVFRISFPCPLFLCLSSVVFFAIFVFFCGSLALSAD